LAKFEMEMNHDQRAGGYDRGGELKDALPRGAIKVQSRSERCEGRLPEPTLAT